LKLSVNTNIQFIVGSQEDLGTKNGVEDAEESDKGELAHGFRIRFDY
jgi:hypothetical protein